VTPVSSKSSSESSGFRSQRSPSSSAFLGRSVGWCPDLCRWRVERPQPAHQVADLLARAGFEQPGHLGNDLGNFARQLADAGGVASGPDGKLRAASRSQHFDQVKIGARWLGDASFKLKAAALDFEPLELDVFLTLELRDAALLGHDLLLRLVERDLVPLFS